MAVAGALWLSGAQGGAAKGWLGGSQCWRHLALSKLLWAPVAPFGAPWGLLTLQPGFLCRLHGCAVLFCSVGPLGLAGLVGEGSFCGQLGPSWAPAGLSGAVIGRGESFFGCLWGPQGAPGGQSGFFPVLRRGFFRCVAVSGRLGGFFAHLGGQGVEGLSGGWWWLVSVEAQWLGWCGRPATPVWVCGALAYAKVATLPCWRTPLLALGVKCLSTPVWPQCLER